MMNAAARRGKIRYRANGDVMSNAYGVNSAHSPGPRDNPKFEVGLTSDGRIVHLYHTGGGQVKRVVLNSGQRIGMPLGVQPRLTATPKVAARRARKGKTVTYGNNTTTA